MKESGLPTATWHQRVADWLRAMELLEPPPKS
jgi:hypothetical protein